MVRKSESEFADLIFLQGESGAWISANLPCGVEAYGNMPDCVAIQYGTNLGLNAGPGEYIESKMTFKN